MQYRKRIFDSGILFLNALIPEAGRSYSMEIGTDVTNSEFSAIDWSNGPYFLKTEIDPAGGKLKEKNTTHWLSPNAGATNESGFTAVPNGYRDFDGSFVDLGLYGFIWSITEKSAPYAYYRGMYSANETVGRHYASKHDGFSVRCLKD